jgi:DNA-binding phage protein
LKKKWLKAIRELPHNLRHEKEWLNYQKDTGLERESFYKALSGDVNPSLN